MGIIPHDPYQVIFAYDISDVNDGRSYTFETRYSVDTSLDSFTFTTADANSGWILRVVNTTIPDSYGDLTFKLHYPSDLTNDNTVVEIDNI